MDQERVVKLMQLTVEICGLIEKTKTLGNSRYLSLVGTKLEEAELWLTKEVMVETETAQASG